jgi:hypothetical protein
MMASSIGECGPLVSTVPPLDAEGVDTLDLG